MPLAEYLEGQKSAPPPPAAKPADSAAKLRKQVFTQVAVMIALGLLLAGWYVGYRVYSAPAAQPQIVVSTPVIEVPKPVVTPAVVPPKVESKSEFPKPEPQAAKPEPQVPSPQPQAAKPQPESPIPNPQSQMAKPEPPLTKNQKPETSHRFTRHEASPRAGERYLQIAAFGPKALDGFLKTLEGQGLHPLVAPGPVDNIYRILVGPFSNTTALEQARSLIKASGIEPMLRAY